MAVAGRKERQRAPHQGQGVIGPGRVGSRQQLRAEHPSALGPDAKERLVGELAGVGPRCPGLCAPVDLDQGGVEIERHRHRGVPAKLGVEQVAGRREGGLCRAQVAGAQAPRQLGGRRCRRHVGHRPKLSPGIVGAQVLRVVEGIPADQHRLGHRHDQLARARAAAALLEGAGAGDAIDGAIQALHQAQAPAQLAHHRRAAVGGQGGVVGDDAKGWALVGGAHLLGASLDAAQAAHKAHHCGHFGRHSPPARRATRGSRSEVPRRSWSIRTARRLRDGLTSYPSRSPAGLRFEHLVGDDGRLRREFSRSSSLRRLASSAFMPPYRALQRWKVCSETSRALATSGTPWPSPSSRSASLNFLMICSGGVPASCGHLARVLPARLSDIRTLAASGPISGGRASRARLMASDCVLCTLVSRVAPSSPDAPVTVRRNDPVVRHVAPPGAMPAPQRRAAHRHLLGRRP